MTDETIKSLIVAITGTIITILGILPLFLKSKAKIAIAESVNIKAQSEKEVFEADSMKLVLRLAESAVTQATELGKLREENATARLKEQELLRQIDSLKARIVQLEKLVSELEEDKNARISRGNAG